MNNILKRTLPNSKFKLLKKDSIDIDNAFYGNKTHLKIDRYGYGTVVADILQVMETSTGDFMVEFVLLEEEV